MRPFTEHTGIAAPLLRANIDTDSIIPSMEMKRVSKRGLSSGLFAGWRYTNRTERIENQSFVLNQPGYRQASILLGGENFGCGSSREHAVWALDEYGFRAIIAPSFGSIFAANCIANGVLPARLGAASIDILARHVQTDPQARPLTIDLKRRRIGTVDGQAFRFELADADAELLLRGLDPIGLTLQHSDAIATFEKSDRERRPWAYL